MESNKIKIEEHFKSILSDGKFEFEFSDTSSVSYSSDFAKLSFSFDPRNNQYEGLTLLDKGNNKPFLIGYLLPFQNSGLEYDTDFETELKNSGQIFKSNLQKDAFIIKKFLLKTFIGTNFTWANDYDKFIQENYPWG